MNAVLSTEVDNIEELKAQLKAQPSMKGLALAKSRDEIHRDAQCVHCCQRQDSDGNRCAFHIHGGSHRDGYQVYCRLLYVLHCFHPLKLQYKEYRDASLLLL